jgi:hypothetical protein
MLFSKVNVSPQSSEENEYAHVMRQSQDNDPKFPVFAFGKAAGLA